MTPPRADRYDLAWRRGDLATLFWLCVLAGAAIICCAGRSQRVWFASEPPISPPRVGWAAEKIDPNTATAASLRRLGGIGLVKAQAIVKHRQGPGGRFHQPEDLADVRGIGPETVRRISPYVRFSPAQR